MITIKRKISQRFEKASDSYENVAYVQKESSQFLIERLREFDLEFYPKTILDLGTGTGYIPEILLSHYPDSFYVLNDIAPSMIKKIKDKFEKHSNFKFYIGDMEKLQAQNYDLIISNFALQWTCNLEATLQKFFLESKTFAFSCLLNGTFKEWDNIFKSYGSPSILKQYPTENDLKSYLKTFKAQKYYFDTIDFQLIFPNSRSFMVHLKNLGASTSNTSIPINIIKNVLINQNKEFKITYKVFFGIMKRL